MSTWFTGTSTGDTYKVGQAYENSRGGISWANSDGSFTDDRGRTNVGSSLSQDVTWSSDNNRPDQGVSPSRVIDHLVTDQGRTVEVTAPATGGGVGQGAVATGGGGGTTGAGVERVVAPGRSASPKGVGTTLGGIFDGPNKLKSELKPENTSILYFGHELFLPPGFSNADQWEEMLGEDFGGIVGGLANVGPFIGYNVKLAYNRNVEEWQMAVDDQPAIRGGNAFPALVDTFGAWANDTLAPRRDGLNGEQYRTGGGF